MWYRVTEFQQKILGITGVLLFSFLLILILIDSKLIEESPETLFAIIIAWFIILIVIALLNFWDQVRTA